MHLTGLGISEGEPVFPFRRTGGRTLDLSPVARTRLQEAGAVLDLQPLDVDGLFALDRADGLACAASDAEGRIGHGSW